MDDKATTAWLAEQVRDTLRSSRYCVRGTLEFSDPGLKLADGTAIDFPLSRDAERRLLGDTRQAPFGRKRRTVVDRKVRDTLELDQSQFTVSDRWQTAIAAAARQAAEDLGLPGARVVAHPYKLLAYKKAGFFLAHRDTEKLDGMLATMVVVLPNKFGGGALRVTHRSVVESFDFPAARQGQAAEFAVFYADCSHEVRQVYIGTRVCLVYNLVLSPGGQTPSPPALPGQEAFEAGVEEWLSANPRRPLVFALEHYYTEAGLSLDLLKGADRSLAMIIAEAATNLDCHVYLTQINRDLLACAEDDGAQDRYYRRDYWYPDDEDDDDDDDEYDDDSASESSYNIIEIHEDRIEGDAWHDLMGVAQPWDSIALRSQDIVSRDPLDEWTPTSEEYEGYTGNEGNTLERTYHRTALAIWSRSGHFDIIVQGGAGSCLPVLDALVGDSKRGPKAARELAGKRARELAKSIVAHWTSPRGVFRFDDTRKRAVVQPKGAKLLTRLMNHLFALDLSELAGNLLLKAAADSETALKQVILKAGAAVGWEALGESLMQVLKLHEKGRSYGLPLDRDLEWLEAVSEGAARDEGRLKLSRRLGAEATRLFCRREPNDSDNSDDLEEPVFESLAAGFSDPEVERWQDDAFRSDADVGLRGSSLPSLLRTLARAGLDDSMRAVVDEVLRSPREFSIAASQVPTIVELFAWAREELPQGPPSLVHWCDALRTWLAGATKERPTRPTTMTRAVRFTCRCRWCQQLAAFLNHPTDAQLPFKAAMAQRMHLKEVIERHRCDVSSCVIRRTNPHTLLLTKTDDSYRRATKRFDLQVELLQQLEKLGRHVDEIGSAD